MIKLPTIDRLNEVFFITETATSRTLHWRTTGKGKASAGVEAGTPHNKGYRSVCIDRRWLLTHRILFAMDKGYWPKNQIDHINGDKLDNRSNNLREVTNAQNHMNSPLQKNNVSGIKGVGWCNRLEKWRVQLKLSGKVKHLGYYEDLELAALVRARAEEIYFGEYRRQS